MKTAITLLFLFLGMGMNAQNLDSLFIEKDVHSILKKSRTTLEILDHKNFITKKKYSIVIKNKQAKHLKNVHLYLNDFRDIKSAKVIIRDKNGAEIETYKLKHFEDKVYDLSTIDSDGRYKVLTPAYANFPFEIEVSYEIHHSASLFYDSWQPQYLKMHVIDAELKVIDHTQSNLRYFQKNIGDPLQLKHETATVYLWKLKNVAPKVRESFNRQWEDYFATVVLAPVKFEMEGYKGDLSSWKKFGDWIYQLNATRNTFNAEDIHSIETINLKKESPLETVKSVYKFLQETTRYISIQIGIGGYQPFETKLVHEKKYGDCKALSFYTQSLLELFDIKSYYTLINAGAHKENVKEDFPSPYFNHAILTVPVANDTLFLECTSQTKPFGYAGRFTGNRKALLIDDNQSKLITTQQYTVDDNRQETKVHITLNGADGSASGRIEKNYRGAEIEYQGFLRLYNVTEKKKSDWFQDNFNTGGFMNIDFFTIHPMEGDVYPKGSFSLEFTNRKEAVKRGNRLFLSPHRHMTRIPQIPAENNRKTPIRIRFGYTVEDQITFSLGTSEFSIESKQKDLVLESKFGTYALKTEKKGDSILMQRTFQLKDGIYPSDQFQAFKQFLIKVKKRDRSRMVVNLRTP